MCHNDRCAAMTAGSAGFPGREGPKCHNVTSRGRPGDPPDAAAFPAKSVKARLRDCGNGLYWQIVFDLLHPEEPTVP